MFVPKLVLPCMLCVALPSVASTAGTQRIASHAGTCEMTLPGDWKVDDLLKSVASSPDGSMSAVVSTARDIHALSKVKPIIESAYPPAKVFAGVCGARISFKRAAQVALAKQVALSVKPTS